MRPLKSNFLQKHVSWKTVNDGAIPVAFFLLVPFDTVVKRPETVSFRAKREILQKSNVMVQ